MHRRKQRDDNNDNESRESEIWNLESMIEWVMIIGYILLSATWMHAGHVGLAKTWTRTAFIIQVFFEMLGVYLRRYPIHET